MHEYIPLDAVEAALQGHASGPLSVGPGCAMSRRDDQTLRRFGFLSWQRYLVKQPPCPTRALCNALLQANPALAHKEAA